MHTHSLGNLIAGLRAAEAADNGGPARVLLDQAQLGDDVLEHVHRGAADTDAHGGCQRVLTHTAKTRQVAGLVSLGEGRKITPSCLFSGAMYCFLPTFNSEF